VSIVVSQSGEAFEDHNQSLREWLASRRGEATSSTSVESSDSVVDALKKLRWAAWQQEIKPGSKMLQRTVTADGRRGESMYHRLSGTGDEWVDAVVETMRLGHRPKSLIIQINRALRSLGADIR